MWSLSLVASRGGLCFRYLLRLPDFTESSMEVSEGVRGIAWKPFLSSDVSLETDPAVIK